MVSIKDISRLSGYSITTVSKATNGYKDISEDTRDKILKICREVGYVPNALGRNLSTKRTWTIGIVFQEETELGLTHPFFIELLNEFKLQIEAQGYDILLIGRKIGDFVHSFLSHARQKSVDGIIILSSFPDAEEMQELIASDIPQVVMQSHVDHKNCFYSDNEKAIKEVVYHLYEQGHRDIAFIYGDLNTKDGRERKKGYEAALTELNLPIHEEYLFNGRSYTFAEGKQAAIDLLALPKHPTAVIASSDTLAIGFIREVVEQGYHVPNDFSVTGFDNITLSQISSPRLTTVNQNKKELARRATDCLIQQIEKNYNKANSYVVPCEIVHGKSVKKIN